MSYNKTINNTLLKNYEQLKSKLNFEPLHLCSNTNSQIDPACRMLLQEFLNFSNVKSQSFLFNGLLDRYFQIKKEANAISLTNKNYLRTTDCQSLSLTLKQIIESCAELDRENYKSYHQSLNERIDRCNKQSRELEQVTFENKSYKNPNKLKSHFKTFIRLKNWWKLGGNSRQLTNAYWTHSQLTLAHSTII
jgi:hypothetical protein